MMHCDIISFPANIDMALSLSTFGRHDYIITMNLYGLPTTHWSHGVLSR